MRKDKKNRLQRLAERRNERKNLRKQQFPALCSEFFVGDISINPNGFGFVKVVSEDENTPDKDWFVPAKYLAGAMHGDTVRIALLPPDNRFHDLRHSFAVNSLQAGDNIKNVQANLGHATSAFTMDVYCHVSKSMARESAARTQAFYESVKPV